MNFCLSQSLNVETHPDHETVIADMTDYDTIRSAFRNQDTIVRLAYAHFPSISASNRTVEWSPLLSDNLGATCNVAAAIDAGVDRFVHAFSNHAVGGYELEFRPEIYEPRFDCRVDHEVQPRPDSLYGVLKLYAEGICRPSVEITDCGATPPSRRDPTS